VVFERGGVRYTHPKGFDRLTPGGYCMEIPEFASVDTLRRLWWLHDSFWHAALVKGMGKEGGCWAIVKLM